jgi:hypothetical protein
MDLAEIQHAIEELPKEQQAALAAWLAERDQAEWDAEIKRDFAPGGAGVALLEEMKADVRAGKFRPFEEGPAAEALTSGCSSDPLPPSASGSCTASCRPKCSAWRTSNTNCSAKIRFIPSLHLKHVGEVWTARVGRSHRVIGYREGDAFYWGSAPTRRTRSFCGG